MTESTLADPPLTGIRVIDLSQYAPGPYASRLLCDLGATVIKIEPPSGDPMRRMFCDDEEPTSAIYRLLNAGKVIARLDLKQEAIAESVGNLIGQADVLIESFRPGVMSRLGFSWAECRSINPKLVYASLSGYGQNGPAAYKAGHDINYAAAAGMFSFTDRPRPVFPLVADHSGALSMVNSVLAALVARGRTNRGSYLDVSLYETILSWQYIGVNVSASEREGDRLRLLTGGAACYNVYHTSDNRHVTLGALEPTFWKNFCQAVGQEEWAERQFEVFPQTELISNVATMFSTAPLQEWINKLAEVDCCFEPIPLTDELFNHPQTSARTMYDRQTLSYPARFNDKPLRTSSTTEELEPGITPTWS